MVVLNTPKQEKSSMYDFKNLFPIRTNKSTNMIDIICGIGLLIFTVAIAIATFFLDSGKDYFKIYMTVLKIYASALMVFYSIARTYQIVKENSENGNSENFFLYFFGMVVVVTSFIFSLILIFGADITNLNPKIIIMVLIVLALLNILDIFSKGTQTDGMDMIISAAILILIILAIIAWYYNSPLFVVAAMLLIFLTQSFYYIFFNREAPEKEESYYSFLPGLFTIIAIVGVIYLALKLEVFTAFLSSSTV